MIDGTWDRVTWILWRNRLTGRCYAFGEWKKNRNDMTWYHDALIV